MPDWHPLTLPLHLPTAGRGLAAPHSPARPGSSALREHRAFAVGCGDHGGGRRAVETRAGSGGLQQRWSLLQMWFCDEAGTLLLRTRVRLPTYFLYIAVYPRFRELLGDRLMLHGYPMT